MSLNKYMHPRNIYKNNSLSIKKLKGFSEDLDKLTSEADDGFRFDFSSPKHLSALAKALLKRDFSLTVEIPLERLIPTVPLRLNYILWLEDIFNMNQGVFSSNPQIFDIGIGACCIYPLLGSKNSSWSFYGSEIDTKSYYYAQENVRRNNLESKIKTFLAENREEFFQDLFIKFPEAMIDVVMSNPPFFATQSEAVGADTTRTDRRPKPTSLSTAARHECQTMGGEVYFSFKLAKESLKYQEKIKLVTVMLGKKSSVKTVKKMLEKLKITRFSSYEFCQGRVMRWGLAWSPNSSIKFPVSEFRVKRKLLKPMKMDVPADNKFLSAYTQEIILNWLEVEFRELEMKVYQQKNKSKIGGYHLLIKAYKNTWIHSRRKRRQAQQNTKNFDNKEQMMTEPDEEPIKEPEIKKMRLTEEQTEESSAWSETELDDSTSKEVPIISANVYVKSDQVGFKTEDSSDDEGGSNDGDDREIAKNLLNQNNVGQNFSVYFYLVDSDNSKDVINQLILYLRNRMK